MCQKSKPNQTFWKTLLDGQTKNLFIPLISLRDTVSFDWKIPQLWLAKSILGRISGIRIFPNMKFVQAYSNYSNINFHYRPNRGKIKELKKKPKHSYIQIQRTLGLPYFPHFRPKHCFQKIWLSCTTWHSSLTPCWVPEKLKSQFEENFQTEGRQTLFICITLLAMAWVPIEE